MEEAEADSDVESAQGGELDNEVEKRCAYQECPFPMHADFKGEREGGRRELFICYACHKGIHLEILRAIRMVNQH